MADDRLGRWWHQHNQQAFDQVIDHAIQHWGVDPNRVYLLGISEGGYGTDILGPFMPDRFAGASAMAAGVGLGNPIDNLRNIAFRTDVGERDNMFGRKKMAVAFHERLDKLHAADPEGYTHSINVQEGKGHGVDYRLGPGWIAKHERNPFPSKVVWVDKALAKQHRQQLYWIHRMSEGRKGIERIVATVDREKNQIDITAERLVIEGGGGYETHQATGKEIDTAPLLGDVMELYLSDELVDLNRPVTIIYNGQEQPAIEPTRSAAALLKSLATRPDPAAASSFHLLINTDRDNGSK